VSASLVTSDRNPIPGAYNPGAKAPGFLWAGPSSERRKYNYRASFVQENARKSKENSLDFLAFPWSNLDFSMGYDESK
jgi:hypothetical protein